jgi:hypothetical protein
MIEDASKHLMHAIEPATHQLLAGDNASTDQRRLTPQTTLIVSLSMTA